METGAEKKKRAKRIMTILQKLYPKAQTALHFNSPLEILIATILSAQCTDKRVNQVTPSLFQRFPNVQAYATAELEEIEELIKTTGFFRNKAKNIRSCCLQLIENHGGEVPQSLAELIALPGVGRKTANVVLGEAFDIPGITVDTHVGRLSRRLGFSIHLDPVKVEKDLMAIIPESNWVSFNHWLIFHGRAICHSRKPDCDNCAITKHCPKIITSKLAKPKKRNNQPKIKQNQAK